MGLEKATYTGVDNIMDAYDSINRAGNFYYSVWHSVRDIAFQWPDTDADKGREYLYMNLKAMEQAGNDNLLYLKYHPANPKVLHNGFLDKNSMVVSMSPVRIVELSETSRINGSAAPVNDMNYRMYEAIATIKDLPVKINERLLLFEDRIKAIEDAEYTDPEPNPMDRYMGLINGLSKNPQIMNLLNSIVQKVLPHIPAVAPVNGGQISGTNESEPGEPVNMDVLNNALERLNQHCRLDNDLSLLADLADNDKAQFDMLLRMLRATKN